MREVIYRWILFKCWGRCERGKNLWKSKVCFGEIYIDEGEVNDDDDDDVWLFDLWIVC